MGKGQARGGGCQVSGACLGTAFRRVSAPLFSVVSRRVSDRRPVGVCAQTSSCRTI